MMKKTVLIINPISGIGKQGAVENLAPQIIDSALHSYEIVYTQHAGHVKQLCKHYAALAYDVVCVVGGDGTVHEAINGLINTNTALCIIPTGSGNGLARHLRIPLQVNKALQQLNSNNTTRIDCVALNTTYFANVAGIGFDAHVAHAFANAKQRGLKTYIKICIRSIGAYKPINIELETKENIIIKGNYFIAAIGNASQYGNNATICPAAQLSSGAMCVTLVKPMPWWHLSLFLVRLFTGTLRPNKYVQMLTTTELWLNQNKTIAHADGEAVNDAATLHFKIVPNCLLVVVS